MSIIYNLDRFLLKPSLNNLLPLPPVLKKILYLDINTTAKKNYHLEKPYKGKLPVTVTLYFVKGHPVHVIQCFLVCVAEGTE